MQSLSNEPIGLRLEFPSKEQHVKLKSLSNLLLPGKNELKQSHRILVSF